jgi:hypothetical protein
VSHQQDQLLRILISIFVLKFLNLTRENLNLLEEKLFDMVHAETNEKWTTLNVEVEKVWSYSETAI